MTARLVEFQGQRLWFLDHDDDGSGSLAPLDHCDSDGELDWFQCFKSDTWGHVYADGSIKRYGTVVGRREDLRDVSDEKPEDAANEDDPIDNRR